MIAVADSIPSKVVPTDPKIEMVTVALFNTPLLLSCIYMPPNSCDSYCSDVLTCIASVVSGNSSAIITGDFNMPDINWQTLSASSPSSLSFCDLIFSLNLKQLVTQSTHTHGNILDLVMTNEENLVHDLQVNNSICSTFSDDSLICFSVHPLYKTSEEGCLPLLQGCLCSHLDSFSLPPAATINDMWSSLRDSLHKARSMFIPFSLPPSRNSPPWFTHNIHHSLNRTHSLRKRYRRHPSDSLLSRITYEESQLTDQIKSAKSDYEGYLIASFQSNQLLYRHLRRFASSVYYKATSASDAYTKVNLFNSYFNSIFSSSSDFILPPMSQLPTPSAQLSTINISSEDVYLAIMSLNQNKAFGCDQLSPHFLRLCGGSIVRAVTTLFKESITYGHIPDEWKVHKITPIFKAGDRHCVGNYRPISLLCILSKVLESIIYSKIIPFIGRLLFQNQFGFLKNRSAISQLLLSFSNIM